MRDRREHPCRAREGPPDASPKYRSAPSMRRRRPKRSPRRPPMGCNAAIAMRYVVMSHDAAARSTPASRAIAGRATTSMVEFRGTSALPSAMEPISLSEDGVTARDYGPRHPRARHRTLARGRSAAARREMAKQAGPKRTKQKNNRITAMKAEKERKARRGPDRPPR